MINQAGFWDKEKDAPILRKNDGFINPESIESIIARAEKLVDLLPSIPQIDDEIISSNVPSEEMSRIFVLDAERTFTDPSNRQLMVEALNFIWRELLDYHQGLGFIVAFLLLFLPLKNVYKIVLSLNKDYIPGYFKSRSVEYFRDAKVFGKIIEILCPEFSTHLKKHAICPEAFCSKWFIGLCVHVLPFEALFTFLEALLSKKDEFLFQFGVSLIRNCETDLMSTEDVSRIFAILRFDRSIYSHDVSSEDGIRGSFFMKVVDDAISLNLEGIDLKSMRECAKEEMEAAEQERKKRDAEIATFSDDEIVFSDEE